MKRIIVATLLILLVSTGACKAQTCDELPATFSTYPEAVQVIESAEFIYIDKLPPGKNSWIISASFYSCNEYTGYLILTTEKGNEFIHADVPKQVWVEFKKAQSPGAFYDYNIKGRYMLALKYKKKPAN